jgi:hypothetical protein
VRRRIVNSSLLPSWRVGLFLSLTGLLLGGCGGAFGSLGGPSTVDCPDGERVVVSCEQYTRTTSCGGGAEIGTSGVGLNAHCEERATDQDNPELRKMMMALATLCNEYNSCIRDRGEYLEAKKRWEQMLYGDGPTAPAAAPAPRTSATPAPRTSSPPTAAEFEPAPRAPERHETAKPRARLTVEEKRLDAHRPRPHGASAANRVDEELKALVRDWASWQSEGRYRPYSQAYDHSFVGIKRTKSGNQKTYNRDKWLADRRSMFTKGQTVAVRNITLVEARGGRATVRFTQYWRSGSGRYKDQGLKELQLRQDSGVWRITREDMLSSAPWDGALPRRPGAERDHSETRGAVTGPEEAYRATIHAWNERDERGYYAGISRSPYCFYNKSLDAHRFEGGKDKRLRRYQFGRLPGSATPPHRIDLKHIEAVLSSDDEVLLWVRGFLTVPSRPIKKPGSPATTKHNQLILMQLNAAGRWQMNGEADMHAYDCMQDKLRRIDNETMMRIQRAD